MTNPAIHPELAELILSLTDAGLTIYAYPETPPRQLTWVVAERNGNTCVVSITRFDGFTVTACIRPSREYGSGVSVDIEPYLRAGRGVPGDPETITERVVAAAIKGTKPTVRVRFCKVNPVVPNDGMKHFSWANLVRVAP